MKESQLKVGMNYEDIFLIYGLDRDIAYYVTYLCTGAPSLTKFPLHCKCLQTNDRQTNV